MAKISKRTVDSLRVGSSKREIVIWDGKLSGFGSRFPELERATQAVNTGLREDKGRKLRTHAVRPALWISLVVVALVSSSGPLLADSEAPDAPAWATRAVMPAATVRGLGVFFPANGKFYVLGGRSSDVAGSDILQPREYDPASNSWTTKSATFPTSQVNNMVGGVLKVGGTEYIIAVGGSAAAQTMGTADVRLYDPIPDVLTAVVTDPWPGGAGGTILPGGAAVYNNKLYVFGGFDINVSMLTQIWRYDPAQAPGARWTQMASALPTALGFLPTSTSGAHIYTLGGSTFVGAVLADSNLAFRFDPAADSITPIAVVPRMVGETRAVTELDGRIWVLGGGRTAPNPSNQVDVYAPLLDTWSLGPAMPTARRNFPADVNPVSGDIWAVGGYAPTAPSDVNENLTENRIFGDGFEGGGLCAWGAVPGDSYSFTRDLYGELVVGSADTGNHGDDTSTLIALPFPYELYEGLYNNVNVGSNGHLTFGTVDNGFDVSCMPVADATYAIGPYWTDQCTGACENVTCAGCGIFTSTTGTAPTRIFNIEYRTRYYNSGGAGVPLNYEVRLYEGQNRFDLIYDTVSIFVPPAARNVSVGVQRTSTTGGCVVGCDAGGGASPPVESGEIYIFQGCSGLP